MFQQYIINDRYIKCRGISVKTTVKYDLRALHFSS